MNKRVINSTFGPNGLSADTFWCTSASSQRLIKKKKNVYIIMLCAQVGFLYIPSEAVTKCVKALLYDNSGDRFGAEVRESDSK